MTRKLVKNIYCRSEAAPSLPIVERWRWRLMIFTEITSVLPVSLFNQNSLYRIKKWSPTKHKCLRISLPQLYIVVSVCVLKAEGRTVYDYMVVVTSQGKTWFFQGSLNLGLEMRLLLLQVHAMRQFYSSETRMHSLMEIIRSWSLTSNMWVLSTVWKWHSVILGRELWVFFSRAGDCARIGEVLKMVTLYRLLSVVTIHKLCLFIFRWLTRRNSNLCKLFPSRTIAQLIESHLHEQSPFQTAKPTYLSHLKTTPLTHSFSKFSPTLRVLCVYAYLYIRPIRYLNSVQNATIRINVSQ